MGKKMPSAQEKWMAMSPVSSAAASVVPMNSEAATTQMAICVMPTPPTPSNLPARRSLGLTTASITSNPKIGITPGLGAQHEGVPQINVSGGFGIGNDFEGERSEERRVGT